MWYGDMMGWGWGGGWSWFGIFHMLLWWALIIVAIVVLARWGFTGGSGYSGRHQAEDRALSILRERYARGEIDKAEFEARRRDLSG